MLVDIRIGNLPENPLEASLLFYNQYVPKAANTLTGGVDHLVFILPPADATHDDWRRAVARDLGRTYAPKQVSIIGGGDRASVDEVLAYLRAAPGITGQYLPLNDKPS